MAHRSYREGVRVLRQFEGAHCLWRPAVGALLFGASWLAPFAGFVAGAYVADDLGSLTRVVLGALVAVGLGLAGERVRRTKPWETLVARRLSTYEDPQGGRSLFVLIRERDFARAHAVLRRAKLHPQSSLRVGSPPVDAPVLTIQITVMEPARWRKSVSYDGLVDRVVEVFRRAQMQARVAGVDAHASCLLGPSR